MMEINPYTYEIVVRERNKKSVIAHIKTNRVTVHIVRGHDLETVEAAAKDWIDERTGMKAHRRDKLRRLRRPPVKAKLRSPKPDQQV